ncbi:MAG: fructosamine kinase family protein [Lactobacillaceae bacterium]
MMNQEWIKRLPIKKINKVISVSGGDVNKAFRIETDDKNYFLLVQPHASSHFYDGEIAGLKTFAAVNIPAPRVIANGQILGDAYLILNFLTSGHGSQTDLGYLVAKLHKNYSKNKKFGFTTNYQGNEMTFDNTWTTSWIELFVENRLDHLKDLALKKDLWHENEIIQYQKVRKIIVNTLKQHSSKPSLLHGDLWGGNYMFTSDSMPVLIDPACFYGDREFDIGITTVFGGFTSEFYNAYQQIFPLDEGYQFRINFYRLYYLMLHLNKFGNIYASSVQTVLDQILNNE